MKISTISTTPITEQRIHARHIDLAVIGGRGVADFHARQLSELHRLRVMEKTPEITACEAMMVAKVASTTSG